MESVLAYLGSLHGEAVVDAMRSGPARVTEPYGLRAFAPFWHQSGAAFSRRGRRS
jgi:hypothetical protein